MRVVVAITGATGAVYGITLLKALAGAGVETHLVISRWAGETIRLETDFSPEQVAKMAFRCYSPDDQGAPPASGSFRHGGMVIAPCSMKTLSAVASGYADNLISRAADVTLKEKRPLILLPRETPLSVIHLENMIRVARAGAVIMPPMPSFYHRPETIGDIVNQTVGRVMDLLGIENSMVRRWDGRALKIQEKE